ncbi:MAG TPA: Ig-like domain-containing protein, partial [Acidobacteriaceae bacterium]
MRTIAWKRHLCYSAIASAVLVITGCGYSAKQAARATSSAGSAQPISLACSVNPSVVSLGQSATITSAASNPANLPLTYSYNASSGSVSGNGSTALFNTQGMQVGTVMFSCKIVASNGESASASTTLSIQAPVLLAPSVVITASPNPAITGSPVLLSASVAGDGATSAVPNGTITFMDGTATVGTGVLDAKGTTSLTVPTLSPGSHTLQAEYQGDNVYAAAVSVDLILAVQSAPSAPTPPPTP